MGVAIVNVVVIGLSTADAVARLAADGPNAVAKPRPRRLIGRIGAQLADPLVALLLAASVVTLILRDWTDTAVILLVVVLNTAIGVAQQIRPARPPADGAASHLPLGTCGPDRSRGPVGRSKHGHHRHLAEGEALRRNAFRPWKPVFVHGDLQLTHVLVDGDEIAGVIAAQCRHHVESA